MDYDYGGYRGTIDITITLNTSTVRTRCGAGEGTRDPVSPGRANMCWCVCWCWCWCMCWCWWMSARTYGVEPSTGRPAGSWAAKNLRFNSSRRISWPLIKREIHHINMIGRVILALLFSFITESDRILIKIIMITPTLPAVIYCFLCAAIGNMRLTYQCRLVQIIMKTLTGKGHGFRGSMCWQVGSS